MRINSTNLLKKLCPEFDSDFDWAEDFIQLPKLNNVEKFLEKNFYLDGYLHDSEFLGMRNNDKKLVLSFNDFNIFHLFFTLNNCKNLKISKKIAKFPVDFVFKNVEVCTLNYINRNSKIIPLDCKKYINSLKDLLSIKLIHIDEKCVEIAFLFWSTLKRRKELLLLIKAKSLFINERQEEKWDSIFNGKYNKLLKIVEEETLKRGFLDQNKMDKLVQKNI